MLLHLGGQVLVGSVHANNAHPVRQFVVHYIKHRFVENRQFIRLMQITLRSDREATRIRSRRVQTYLCEEYDLLAVDFADLTADEPRAVLGAWRVLQEEEEELEEADASEHEHYQKHLSSGRQ